MSRTPLVAGNWKMNGSLADIDTFARQLQVGALTGVDLLVCVPFVYLERLVSRLAGKPVAVGGEHVASEPVAGALTGEVSAAMLADVGCTYVIVGHSERRALYGETDAIVAAKANAAAAAGLQPIACVGETLEEREQGRAESVLQRQIQTLMTACDDITLDKLVIAYEPVWAIGTGHSATPEQVQAMHAFIREHIAENNVTLSRLMRLIYGGSVKPDNAVGLFAGEDVDGALVGGASLKASSFMAIARAAN